MNLPRPDFENWLDEDEELEFARQCQRSDEAELDALCHHGVDRWDLLPND